MISDRFDVAIERAAWRYPESPPKMIYLNEADWLEYDAEIRETWPSAVRCFSYRDLQIRSSRGRSKLFTKHGCSVLIPRSVSRRTQSA